MRSFRDLKVWENAHKLTLTIYKATAAFPSEERYGITRQIRRACASIPANIAEGCGRGSEVELARFLQIAIGSASELEYHLLLAKDLRLMKPDRYDSLEQQVTEIKKMLASFIRKLRADR